MLLLPVTCTAPSAACMRDSASHWHLLKVVPETPSSNKRAMPAGAGESSEHLSCIMASCCFLCYTFGGLSRHSNVAARTSGLLSVSPCAPESLSSDHWASARAEAEGCQTVGLLRGSPPKRRLCRICRSSYGCLSAMCVVVLQTTLVSPWTFEIRQLSACKFRHSRLRWLACVFLETILWAAKSICMINAQGLGSN
jgi:hypothetical protein